MKMRYSIEPKDRIYIKEYGFLSFAKNMGTHANKVSKNLYSKYSQKTSWYSKYDQKLLDTPKKSTADAIKTASSKVTQKIAKANDDLIGNKIADKITNILKKFSRELHSQNNEANDEMEIPKESVYISKKILQIINELRLL